MKTSLTISTISFNTPEFLLTKLRELFSAKVISFWAFIVHQPEDDEGGKKQHQHLFIEPSKMLQTDELRDEFKEFDPSKPEKPLSVIGFRISKFDDWYLYVLHDRRYLALKNQSRKFHYVHEDLLTSDPDDLLFRAKSIDLLSLSRYADIESAIRSGITLSEYFRRGTVPFQQVNQFIRAWDLISNDILHRDGRPAHVDADTGELIEG